MKKHHKCKPAGWKCPWRPDPIEAVPNKVWRLFRQPLNFLRAPASWARTTAETPKTKLEMKQKRYSPTSSWSLRNHCGLRTFIVLRRKATENGTMRSGLCFGMPHRGQGSQTIILLSDYSKCSQVSAGIPLNRYQWSMQCSGLSFLPDRIFDHLKQMDHTDTRNSRHFKIGLNSFGFFWLHLFQLSCQGQWSLNLCYLALFQWRQKNEQHQVKQAGKLVISTLVPSVLSHTVIQDAAFSKAAGLNSWVVSLRSGPSPSTRRHR